MSKFRAIVLAAAVSVPFAVGLTSSANAGGLFGDAVEVLCGNCGAGRALDRANENIGHPAERAAEGAATYYGGPAAGAAANAWFSTHGAPIR